MISDVATQAVLYGEVLEQAAGKPVIFRTIDVGGDKVLPIGRSPGDNPAMGWRASASASTGLPSCANSCGPCCSPTPSAIFA